MKPNRRRIANAFLMLALIFLALGLSMNNTAFSWVAVAFIVISLIAGGRWLRPRGRGR
jgi:hypothetical protein